MEKETHLAVDVAVYVAATVDHAFAAQVIKLALVVAELSDNFIESSRI